MFVMAEDDERSRTPNRYNYNENLKTSEQRGEGLIATLFKYHHQQGYIAFAIKNKFEYYSIPYPRMTQVNNKDSIGRPTFEPAVIKILDLQPIEIPPKHEQTFLGPLAISFVQENNRLCILVYQHIIVIIDCLQKCVIKRLKQSRNFCVNNNNVAFKTKNGFGEINMTSGHIG